jgi:dolichol-phosphate mannosyltransferase
MSDEPWLILPTYNEAENIEAIVIAAGEVLERAAPDGFSVLVVDDGSPDGTGEIADRLAGEHEWVQVLHRTEKNGIGPAYLAGFRYALDHGAGYVMEMDSDFSHNPADLARLLAAVKGGADLALGSRYVPGGGVVDWGLLRRFISEGGSTYARIVLGLKVKDLTGGFKCFRREVLEEIHFDGVRSQGYAFQVELTYRAVRAGFQVVEVPIVFKDRERGQSKMSWRIAAEAMWLVPRLRFK